MVEEAALPDFNGSAINSASKARELLKGYAPASVIYVFANDILERLYADGVDSLTESEAHLAALQIYQTSVASDSFGSLYYNEGHLIQIMLAATRQTGAAVAHSLLVRGLAELGLTEKASGAQILKAGQGIIDAMSTYVSSPRDIVSDGVQARGGNRLHFLGIPHWIIGSLGQLGSRKGKSRRLLDAFETLDREFDESVGHLDDEMLVILQSPASDFKNFP